jgi:carbamoyl-phosphate synthase small subunit
MQFHVKPPAVLLLEDGTEFMGRACGIRGTSSGEICFNTGMTGYQEIFTDPSYFGQILVTTHVHIGNYGINEAEMESTGVKIAGLVCKSFNDIPSRYNSIGSLQLFFEQHRIVGISDIDTRALVRHIRSSGVMNAIISSEDLDIKSLKKQLQKVPSMKGLELSSKVTTTEPYYYGNPEAKYRIAVVDLGIKRNILTCLAERDCYCKVFPMNSSVSEMEAWNPHGYVLSNGPGDPEPLRIVIENVKELIEKNKRIFGICLGHQVISWAMGVSTYKMFNGHRGINHPVLNHLSGKGEITSQNHGFVTDEKVLKDHPDIEVTHQHLNDMTVAGIKLKNKPVFSVQYHPEASSGPHDSRYLFDEFIRILE